MRITGHKNVKVFFSHGGMLGVLEAVHCGVPIIVTPLYRDQFINAAAVEQQGIGVILPFEDITEKAYEISRAAMQTE
jgi:glucuronosyltransferase